MLGSSRLGGVALAERDHVRGDQGCRCWGHQAITPVTSLGVAMWMSRGPRRRAHGRRPVTQPVSVTVWTMSGRDPNGAELEGRQHRVVPGSLRLPRRHPRGSRCRPEVRPDTGPQVARRAMWRGAIADHQGRAHRAADATAGPGRGVTAQGPAEPVYRGAAAKVSASDPVALLIRMLTVELLLGGGEQHGLRGRTGRSASTESRLPAAPDVGDDRCGVLCPVVGDGLGFRDRRAIDSQDA